MRSFRSLIEVKKMVTLVDLTDREIADLREFTNETSLAKAIRAATRQYVQYARRMRLLREFSGRIELVDRGRGGEGSG